MCKYRYTKYWFVVEFYVAQTQTQSRTLDRFFVTDARFYRRHRRKQKTFAKKYNMMVSRNSERSFACMSSKSTFISNGKYFVFRFISFRLVFITSLRPLKYNIYSRVDELQSYFTFVYVIRLLANRLTWRDQPMKKR